MKNKLYYIVGFLIVLIVGIIYTYTTNSVEVEINNEDGLVNEDSSSGSKEDIDESKENNEQEEEEENIYVHICGSVAKEGVYTVREGARVYEALELAGGLTEEAVTDYVNLARCVKDGEQIIFPSRNQIEAGEFQYDNEDNNFVNINTASIEKLMTLSGIGESKAKLIIEYREKNGDYKSIEDIMKISGIKQEAFNKIKDSIIVK
ncbi:MAG: helix-hairpin-helix domain-containing protein [Vallitalea sp.]|nr:helix-hairpin-helix domain-containing protein [Vallitalea sp.]